MQVSVISFTDMNSCVEILCAYILTILSHSFHIQFQIGTMETNQITWL
jgi:hypothetical protein